MKKDLPAFALLILAALAAPAKAEPVSVEELAGLARAGVGEKVLLALVETQGLADSVGVKALFSLKEAGLSDEGLASLILFAAGQDRAQGPSDGDPDEDEDGADEGITFGEEDGVLVVRGRSSGASDSAESMVGQSSLDAGLAAPMGQLPLSGAAPPQIIYVQAPAPVALPPQAAPVLYPTPVHASQSPVGAVFIPAQQSRRNGPFGTTVVGLAAPVLYHPNAAPVSIHHADGHENAHRHPSRQRGRYGTVAIRTSRGTRFIPN